MAGTQRPSFLKRQKEQKRLGRALEKRQAKQARRDARTQSPDGIVADAPGTGMPVDPDAELQSAGEIAESAPETGTDD